MKCTNCGAEGKEGARFCEACGTPLEAPIEEKKPEAPAEEAAKPAEALEEKQNDAPPAQAEQAPPPKKKSARKIALAATALVLVVALVLHVDSIISFALPMLFGAISGSYSSIFLSGPIWVRWMEKKAAKK